VRAPRSTREGVRACVDRDRERIGISPGAIEYVAAITRANVEDDVAECGGVCGGLTDVYVDDPLAEKSSHGRYLSRHRERPRRAE
jgi:hypothetical protein